MDIQEKMIFKSREDEAKERSKKVAQELHQAARDKKIKDMLHSIHHAHEKTMSEDTEHLGNVVGLVANHDFAGATEIVHDLLNQRVVGALDEYKRTVAQNLFSPIPAELEEEVEQIEEEQIEEEQLNELNTSTMRSYLDKRGKQIRDDIAKYNIDKSNGRPKLKHFKGVSKASSKIVDREYPIKSEK